MARLQAVRQYTSNFLKKLSGGGSIQTGLYFQNRRTYSTKIGGIITLLMYIGVVIYAIIVIDGIIKRETMTLSQESKNLFKVSELPLLPYPANPDCLDMSLLFGEDSCSDGVVNDTRTIISQGLSTTGTYPFDTQFQNITQCYQDDGELILSRFQCLVNESLMNISRTYDGAHPLFQVIKIEMSEKDYYFLDYNEYQFDSKGIFKFVQRIVFNNLNLNDGSYLETSIYLNLVSVRTTNDILRLGDIKFEQEYYYQLHSYQNSEVDLSGFIPMKTSYLQFELMLGKITEYTYYPTSLWIGLSQIGGALGISGLVTVLVKIINEKYFLKSLAKAHAQTIQSSDKQTCRQKLRSFFFSNQQLQKACLDAQNNLSYENWIQMKNQLSQLSSEFNQLKQQINIQPPQNDDDSIIENSQHTITSQNLIDDNNGMTDQIRVESETALEQKPPSSSRSGFKGNNYV